MAGRIARSAAAFALCVLLAGGVARAGPAEVKSPLEATRTGATITVALLRALDDATVEAYVLQTLMGGIETIGGTQTCVAADNSVSHRPSALANPPFSEESIQQREHLIRTLGVYGFVEALVSRGASRSELAVALANFQRAAFTLHAFANVHTSGDLFVDERAATLLALAKALRSAKNQATLKRIVAKGSPTIAKLITILRTDVSRRRREALSAAALEVALWRAYGTESARGALQRPGLPLCNGPVATNPDPHDQVPPVPIANMPEAIRTGLKRAIGRAAALQAVNLNPFFSALLGLNAASSAGPPAIEVALQRLDASLVAPEKAARPLFNGSTQ